MAFSKMRTVQARRLFATFRSVEGEFGGGGRSSVSGLKVAVFGATGFLGRYVCNEIGQVGSTAYIANRGCEMETRHLKPMFDLGNAAFYFYSPRDPESIAKVVEGANVVINMVGKRYETKRLVPTDPATGETSLLKGSRINYSYEDVNVGVAEAIAKAAAAEPSVEKLIHVSCLGAAPDSPSVLMQTKFAGEEAVKASFPDATIVRPATLFGHEDWFLNWYAWFGERLRMPLVEDGSALVQPVFVGDVAKAIMAAVEDADGSLSGATLELAGPTDYSRAEIAAFVKDVAKMEKEPVLVPKPLLSLAGKAVETCLFDPYLTKDDVEVMSMDVVSDAAAAKAAGMVTFEDLGIEPTPLEKVAFQYLHRYRKGGHFVYAAGYH